MNNEIFIWRENQTKPWEKYNFEWVWSEDKNLLFGALGENFLLCVLCGHDCAFARKLKGISSTNSGERMFFNKVSIHNLR